jgi:hypothetical protein
MPWEALGGRSTAHFLISALEGAAWSASAPTALILGKEPPGTQCTGGWVGPRAGWTQRLEEKTIRLCRESNPGRSVRRQ